MGRTADTRLSFTPVRVIKWILPIVGIYIYAVNAALGTLYFLVYYAMYVVFRRYFGGRKYVTDRIPAGERGYTHTSPEGGLLSTPYNDLTTDPSGYVSKFGGTEDDPEIIARKFASGNFGGRLLGMGRGTGGMPEIADGISRFLSENDFIGLFNFMLALISGRILAALPSLRRAYAGFRRATHPDTEIIRRTDRVTGPSDLTSDLPLKAIVNFSESFGRLTGFDGFIGLTEYIKDIRFKIDRLVNSEAGSGAVSSLYGDIIGNITEILPTLVGIYYLMTDNYFPEILAERFIYNRKFVKELENILRSDTERRLLITRYTGIDPDVLAFLSSYPEKTDAATVIGRTALIFRPAARNGTDYAGIAYRLYKKAAGNVSELGRKFIRTVHPEIVIGLAAFNLKTAFYIRNLYRKIDNAEKIRKYIFPVYLRTVAPVSYLFAAAAFLFNVIYVSYGIGGGFFPLPGTLLLITAILLHYSACIGNSAWKKVGRSK